MKINIAAYEKKGVIKVVEAKNLSRKLYYEEYKGYLFCNEDDCNAKLSFVERKGNIKFFRTYPSTDHKQGCPNEVSYNVSTRKSTAESYEGKINISNKHIENTLGRAFDNFKNVKNGEDFVVIDGRPYIKKTKGNEIKGSIPELFGDGMDNNLGKEPYIITRLYNEIDKNDDKEIRCIIGYVNNLQLMDKHGYINLTPKTVHSVKIHFEEYFVVNNRNEFNNMIIIKNYIKLMKTKNRPILCCCIGRIKYVNTGINIMLDRYQAFRLNGMRFYQILSYMNDLKEEG